MKTTPCTRLLPRFRAEYGRAAGALAIAFVLLPFVHDCRAASRNIRVDQPQDPCALWQWGPQTNDPYYESDDNSGSGPAFSPGTTVSYSPTYCTPNILPLFTIWGSLSINDPGQLEAAQDPANPASSPASSGANRGLPTDWTYAASTATIYDWAPNSDGSGQPQAQLVIWTVPSQTWYEFEFDLWCQNAASAQFTWTGNVYTTNCSTFSGADLLIDQNSGLPDGSVTNPANTVVPPNQPIPDWSITKYVSVSGTATPSPVPPATPFSISAAFTDTGGSPITVGTAQLLNGTTVLGSAPLNGLGGASFSLPGMPAGNYTFMIAYLGVSGQTLPNSISLPLTISPPPPTLSVSPTTIALGQNATLTWKSEDATSCTAGNGWSGPEPLSGSFQVTPTSTGTIEYDLACAANGVQALSSVTLTVDPPPPTVTVSVSPTAIAVGQSATLTWSSTSATSCMAESAADPTWNGSQATSGTFTVTPKAAGGYAYSLSCTGAGGTGNGAAALVVNAAQPQPGSAPTVTVSVSPATIGVGQSATLTWSSTNATSCMADSAWTGTQATSGTLTVSPANAGGYAYSLTCSGSGGTANGATALSVVAASAPASSSTSQSSSGKGGGGAWGILDLLALGCLAGLKVAGPGRSRKQIEH